MDSNRWRRFTMPNYGQMESENAIDKYAVAVIRKD